MPADLTEPVRPAFYHALLMRSVARAGLTLYSDDRPTATARRRPRSRPSVSRRCCRFWLRSFAAALFDRKQQHARRLWRLSTRAVSVGVVARQPTEGGVASEAAAAPPARSTEGRTSGRTDGSRDRLFLVLNFLSAFAVVLPSRLQSLSLPLPSSSLPLPHAHKQAPLT